MGKDQKSNPGDDGFDGTKLLGEFIKLLRQERCLTLDQVGKSLGCSRQAVWSYESGEDNIPDHHIEKLAFALSISPGDLAKAILCCYHPTVYKMISGLPEGDIGPFKELYLKSFEE